MILALEDAMRVTGEREREREKATLVYILPTHWTHAVLYVVQTKQHLSVHGMPRDTLLWLLRPNHDRPQLLLSNITTSMKTRGPFKCSNYEIKITVQTALLHFKTQAFHDES